MIMMMHKPAAIFGSPGKGMALDFGIGKRSPLTYSSLSIPR